MDHLLLALDVGNTNTVVGLFRGEELQTHWRLTTHAERTADEARVVTQVSPQLHP